MSNCFDRLDQGARRNLLHAVAVECALIADEIAELGASISAGGLASAATMAKFQAFDYLSQHARSQAALVEGIARCENSVQHLTSLIEEIPLPAVRHRFRRIFGSQTEAPAAEHDIAVLWLEAP